MRTSRCRILMEEKLFKRVLNLRLIVQKEMMFPPVTTIFCSNSRSFTGGRQTLSLFFSGESLIWPSPVKNRTEWTTYKNRNGYYVWNHKFCDVRYNSYDVDLVSPCTTLTFFFNLLMLIYVKRLHLLHNSVRKIVKETSVFSGPLWYFEETSHEKLGTLKF